MRMQCARDVIMQMCYCFDKFTRPIKLSHDAGESINDMKKKGFIKNHHIGKCVFC